MTPNITTLAPTKSTSYRGPLAAIVLVATAAFPLSQASAVSGAVKVACMADYFSYCSAHQVDTPQLRRCMSAAGPKLSTRCINALIAAGEVSKAEVQRRAASLRQAAR